MSEDFPYGDGIIPCVLWSAVTGVCLVAKLFSADLYNRPGSSFVCQTANCHCDNVRVLNIRVWKSAREQ